MRFLLAVSLLLALPLSLLVLLFALATSPVPPVGMGTGLSVADLERGRQVWKSLAPGSLREGAVRQVTLSGGDLALGLNFLAGRLGLAGAGATVRRDALVIRASTHLQGLPQVRYLNLELTLRPAGDLLAPAGLRLGHVPLPAGMMGPVMDWGLRLSPVAPQYRVARDMLRGVRLGEGRVSLAFVWRGQALEAAMAEGAGLDAQALEAHRQHLAGQAGAEFAPLLGRAFEHARKRSAKGDPVAENRAALTALAERALGTRLVTVRGVAGPRPGGGLRLAGRADFAQHFALSAFLAATGGEGFSDLAGLYKELRDAREGSGFSFNDLAADRAGSRLGEASTHSERGARRIQAALAGAKDARAFFPRVDDLPEFMGQAEFRRRFGGPEAPAYQAMADKIEQRIAALPLYR